MLKTPHLKNVYCYEIFMRTQRLGPGLILIGTGGENTGECGNELSGSIKWGEFLE